MTHRLAILCPGQGAQHAAMFDLARTDQRAGMLLDQWRIDSYLGAPLDTVLSDPSLLFANRLAQPLIVAATLTAWEAIRNSLPEPAIIAGYSIGELSAYGVAGSLAAEDAIALAASRAQLMDACLDNLPKQALISVSGVNIRMLRDVLAQHRFYVAIETGEDSVIAGGLFESVPVVERGVIALGGRIGVLPVEVASHTPLMLPAVAPFSRDLMRYQFNDPGIPVVSGIAAQRVQNAAQAIASLSSQIAETILWKDCMDTCAEAGVTFALELGPGSALTRMMHARHPEIECRSMAEFRTIEGVRKWVERCVG